MNAEQPPWFGRSYYQSNPQKPDWLKLLSEVILLLESGKRGERVTQVGKRMVEALKDRSKRGVVGYPKLIPQVAAHMDSRELPYDMFTCSDQEWVFKTYAFADGQCPIHGCENLMRPGQCRVIIAEDGRYLWMRNAQAFLTGVGMWVAVA